MMILHMFKESEAPSSTHLLSLLSRNRFDPPAPRFPRRLRHQCVDVSAAFWHLAQQLPPTGANVSVNEGHFVMSN